MKKQIINQMVIMLVLCMVVGLCGTQFAQATDYSKYSSKACGWGLAKNKKQKTPKGTYPYNGFQLKKYNAYYVGNTKDKFIYLTFDCGYENGNTKDILDTLKKYDTTAIFFVTKAFVESQPKLVKRMKKEGHLVGNHTAHHIKLGTATPQKIRKEIQEVEKLVKEKTGYEIDKFVRPPEGNYSQRALKVLQDMGYRTIFWSNAWVDWDVEHQPSVNYVVKQMTDYRHNGMIPLMHNTSSADAKALPKVIETLQKKGYVFERLDDAFKKKADLTIEVKTKTYNGKKVELKIKTKSKGKQKISFFNSKKTKISYPISAGTYYVQVTVEATDIYKEITKTKKFTIKKARPDLKVLIDQTIPEGQDYKPSYKSSCPVKKVQYYYYNEIGEVISKPSKAGIYWVEAYVEESGNYYSASSEKYEFEIEPAVNG